MPIRISTNLYFMTSDVNFGTSSRGPVIRLHAFLCAACLLLPVVAASAQAVRPYTEDEIRKLVADFKEDPRGPFQGIRWFCPDGSVIGARERCAQPGGIQHALPKDVTVRLQTRNGVYLGQILAGTPNDAFLDENNVYSRLKQYQIEQFLIGIDDGWILRKARFYRGAYQAEDEEAWGKQFLEWALAKDEFVRTRFYLLREAARDIPHEAADNLVQRIRGVSREISDDYTAFLDIRVKIHGQPTASDTARVSAFRRQHERRLSPGLLAKMTQLEADLKQQYAVEQGAQLRTAVGKLASTSEIAARVRSADLDRMTPAARAGWIADLIVSIREEIETPGVRGRERLRLVDVSLAAENLLFRIVGEWTPATPAQMLEKFSVLARAAAGSGLLENWEWRELQNHLRRPAARVEITLDEFEVLVGSARRGVEWAIGTVTANFEDAVHLFAAFEPLAHGFLDDRMRSSVLLAMGDAASRLGDELAARSGRVNEVMGLKHGTGIRGLNAGVAVGQLDVVAGAAENITFSTDKIYVLSRAPAELKPVAGIATVSEGNMVSHVQLLARNLGIPNAVLSPELLRALEPMDGRHVFYAVSPGGAVRMKPVESMTAEEKRLVEERKRSEERIRVPIGRLQLDNYRLESLYDLRARDSGRICGPKAANLGQLSSLFPGRVAPGFVIPFGVFRKHMEQSMPGEQQSYWQYLRATFQNASEMRAGGAADAVVEEEILRRLAVLRSAIENMPFDADFVSELRARFAATLGGPLGTIPVFVRSDTNMEDLKDFTGAGLNLTVPNVVAESDVLRAIRRVWASPYRERGYQWRQKYLLNPEDVYPSLLILRSVNVDRSGVMITAGVSTGSADDATVAFNRGVGGAVDGQAAESFLLKSTGGTILLSPAREPSFTVLPSNGGTEKRQTAFDRRILSDDDLGQLRLLADEIRRKLPGTPGIETNGPFDVELGFFGDEIRLFQTRPFVENRSAASITYLSRMDQRANKKARVNLDSRLVATL